jgi:dihydroflavonol-4-reductase
LPLLPRISFAGVHTRDVAELHVRALTDPRARMQRIIAASNSLWLKEMAVVLKRRLGARGARVSTREAPDWLIRAAAIIRPEARFMASNLGKQQLFSSAIAEDILGRPLRSTEEALLAAAESILAARAT